MDGRPNRIYIAAFLNCSGVVLTGPYKQPSLLYYKERISFGNLHLTPAPYFEAAPGNGNNDSMKSASSVKYTTLNLNSQTS